MRKNAYRVCLSFGNESSIHHYFIQKTLTHSHTHANYVSDSRRAWTIPLSVSHTHEIQNIAEYLEKKKNKKTLAFLYQVTIERYGFLFKVFGVFNTIFREADAMWHFVVQTNDVVNTNLAEQFYLWPANNFEYQFSDQYNGNNDKHTNCQRNPFIEHAIVLCLSFTRSCMGGARG